jgi:hypothetical protein
MIQTCFVLYGFTQPLTAMPIMENAQNNSKGFTSRLLWYFPKPIFCKMEERCCLKMKRIKFKYSG